MYPTEKFKDQTENVNVMIVIGSVVNEMIELFKCMSLNAIHRVSQQLCYNIITLPQNHNKYNKNNIIAV